MLITMQGFTSFAQSGSESVTEEEVNAGEIKGTISGSGIPANPVHICTKDTFTDLTTWSYIHFGSYPQSEVTDEVTTAAIDAAIDAGMGEEVYTNPYYADDVWVDGIKYRRVGYNNVDSRIYWYFKWEKLKWRVLQNDGNTLFIMSDVVIDCKDYNEELGKITWENSTLRNWLNNDFYQAAFNNQEKDALVPYNAFSEANPDYDIEIGNNTTDTVSLLSFSEVTNPDYGFCNDREVWSLSRKVSATDYAYYNGAYKELSTVIDRKYCWWWLRLPGSENDYGAVVDHFGRFYGRGYNMTMSYGVAPVVCIKLSSECWENTIMEQVDAPKADVKGGTYSSPQKITLSTTVPGTRILYTLNGGEPNSNNNSKKLYTGPITISESTTLKAFALKSGMEDSETIVEKYIITDEELEDGEGNPPEGEDGSTDREDGSAEEGDNPTGENKNPTVSDNTTGNGDNKPTENKNPTGNNNANANNNITGNNNKNEDNNTSDKNTNDIKVIKLSITSPSKKLAAGKKVQLTLNVTPSNATNKAVTWKSSNTKHATVDSNGKVTLKKAGAGKTVKITATAQDGSGKKATIRIKIMKHAVKSIKITAPSKTVKANTVA